MRSHWAVLRSLLRWNGGRSVLWQAMGVLLALLFVAGLHWGNDGLWYQGDSPRHAANGLFWWDFLASFPVNPISFGLSYYARYPVIHPTAYPPLFYLIEGLAFRVFGLSPFVAKGLVFAFTLLAGLYVTAWLRRWISEEAGWAGALLILQPGIIVWSNVVMLNVPSMALGLAALYHARRWMEAPASRHLYLTAAFALAGIFTYVQTGVVIFVICAWVVMERQWMILWNRRVLILGLLSVLILLPWAVVIIKWAPAHLVSVTSFGRTASLLSRWTYYLKQGTVLFTVPLLVLAGLGFVVGMCTQGWRREVKLLLIWILVCYAAHSYINVRESRYVLCLAPPLALLSIIGLISMLRMGTAYLGREISWLLIAGMAALLVFHAWAAPLVRVPIVHGFPEVVAFLEKVAPDEMIFYDGNFDGVLTFYLRARDQSFRRGVVLGGKLLYASSIMPRLRLTQRISSSAGAVEVLRKEGGCRWVAIERIGVADRVPAARFLREASSGPEFELVKSFPISTHNDTTWVDVYRFLLSVENPNGVDLPFPSLGKGVVFRVNRIEKSH